MKTQRITLISYEYGYQNPELVYVDKDKMHPDPLKKMLWGRSASDPDSIVSDFKGMFEKKGAGVTFEIRGNWITAMEEQKARVEAIKDFIRK